MPEETLTLEAFVKWGGVIFFASCLWFGYELSAGSHLGVTHIASAALFVTALIIAGARGRLIYRRPWGKPWERIVGAVFAGYIVVRLLQSIGNEFFWGQAFKLILIAAVYFAFKILDPVGRYMTFWVSAMPIIFASCIAVGLLIALLSGKILSDRFRVGPNDYEYVAEYSCHMLPMALFSLEQRVQKDWKILTGMATITLLIGLVLAGSRGSLAGGLLGVCTYAFLARKRLGKRSVLLIGGVLLISLLGLLVIGAQRADLATGSIDSENGLNQLTSGRFVHWTFELEQVTESRTTVIFGTGLGRSAEWVTEGDEGGFYRTAIVNALLAAWTPFGLIGLAAYLFLYRHIWRRTKATPAGPFRCMLMSIFFAFVITDQLETHWQGTKMLWFVSFLLYLLTLSRPVLVKQMTGKKRRRIFPAPQRPLLAAYGGHVGARHG